MTARIRLDDMTDDQLDQLYGQLEQATAKAQLYRQRILDIDAHATPYGVREEDPDGSPRAYLITVGSLHRALGTVGHSAAKCDAEAELAAVRALHKPTEHLGITICDACSVERATGPRRWERAAVIPWPCQTVQAINGQP